VNRFRLLSLPLFLIPLAFGALSAQRIAADTTAANKIQIAEASARRWLALVDGAHYGASWDSAGSMFRQQLSQQQWNDAVVAARVQVNPLGARQQTSAQYTRELPNAPPGEYVLLQFLTTARDNTRVTETVVLQKDTDGAWRVVGYFIKPS
jgi:hypothetical protein